MTTGPVGDPEAMDGDAGGETTGEAIARLMRDPGDGPEFAASFFAAAAARGLGDDLFHARMDARLLRPEVGARAGWVGPWWRRPWRTRRRAGARVGRVERDPDAAPLGDVAAVARALGLTLHARLVPLEEAVAAWLAEHASPPA